MLRIFDDYRIPNKYDYIGVEHECLVFAEGQQSILSRSKPVDLDDLYDDYTDYLVDYFDSNKSDFKTFTQFVKEKLNDK